MVSDYLKQTRPIAELKVLIERHQRARVAIAHSTFNQEVTSALSTITEIHQIANARIQADSQVASARIASSAEICALELTANAEIAAIEIQGKRSESDQDSEFVNSMVVQLCRAASSEISASARQSVDQIQAHAETAIAQIGETSRVAVIDIKKFAEASKARMDELHSLSAKEVSDAVLASDASIDSGNAVEDVELTFSSFFKECAEKLAEKVSSSAGNIKAATEAAISSMKTSVEKAEQRIMSAKDIALRKISSLLQVSSK